MMSRQPSAQQRRIGIIGAAGRMGGLAVRAVQESADLELVAALDKDDEIGQLSAFGAETVLHFTHPDVVMDHIQWAISAGMHSVVGTSGIDAERQAQISQWLAGAPHVAVLVVPNFAIGAVLAMEFARQAAPFFESAEVIEIHHAQKADAPSGTAVAAAAGIAAARREAGLGPVPDDTTVDPGHARGASIDGIHVHAVRMPGRVAHVEVQLGSGGEALTLRHDSLSRESFMPGVLAALRAVGGMQGLSVGLAQVLLKSAS